jgi:hypothetical protein
MPAARQHLAAHARPALRLAGAALVLAAASLACAASRTAPIAPEAATSAERSGAEAVSPNELVAAAARAAPRGAYPRYWLGEQPYWTAVGVPGDARKALVGEDGLVEVGERSLSLEPFLTVDGDVVSWADVAIEAALAEGALPMPRVAWRHASGVALAQTTFVAGAAGDAVLYVVHRVENRGPARRRGALWLALRPFQVNPPWQDLHVPGGVSPIHHLARDGRVVWANGAVPVVALTPPDGFGALREAEGSLLAQLAQGRPPRSETVFDRTGLASGVLHFAFDLAPGARREVAVAVPLHAPGGLLARLPPPRDVAAHVAARHDETLRAWRAELAGPVVELPAAAGPIADALRAAVGQILVARVGSALQPGTRTYARAWVRDGVLMASALLQMGRGEEARAFARWFATFQRDDGTVPCCVDRRGADPTVEHDSHGQLIHGIVTLYRFDRDARALRALWPHAWRAALAIDALRQQRRTPAYRQPATGHFFGLLPESISHEGYWQRPVHSYWDDLWALRGLDDAIFAARVLGERAAARRLAAIRDSFQADLAASIRETMRVHGLDTVPASADLGDFDPTATSIGLAPGVAREVFPHRALARTYDRYVADFRDRRSGAREWDAYTPYELRNVEALLRLGRRDDALFLLAEILGDQRPPGFRGWSEIVWRDPRAPKFFGDVPHAWIAAGFVLAARALFVYERPGGGLVLAAGVPLAWAEDPAGVRVASLPTFHGPVGYRIEPAGERRIAVTVDAGPAVPEAGIELRAPAPLRAARVDGRPAAEWSPEAVVLRALPARVELEY